MNNCIKERFLNDTKMILKNKTRERNRQIFLKCAMKNKEMGLITGTRNARSDSRYLLFFLS